MFQYSSAHGDKLRALLTNSKLPIRDKRLIESAYQHYESWLKELFLVDGDIDQRIDKLIALLNRYKLYLDV